ncbi:cupin domain-containing protein [Rufibacter roseolus]|uniref:cupin domain-containing protein n=1 Tax=Rufibacter roseolus TaxID=2817375 RepID=UPI001B3134F1|nr:cupin domain-containing protein [Rufibacter roseolus]
MKAFSPFYLAVFVLLLFSSCTSRSAKKNDTPTSKTSTESKAKETFPLSNLVKENKVTPDQTMVRLHAQHHPHKVLERRTVPGPFTAPSMKYYSHHAVTLDKMPTINPGPGEYVHVMEGQRNGYNNLTIGITETFPGGYPPMHTHEGEESHVLLEGDILYALGDTTFTIKAPYMVNIPPMVPHAFKNVGEETANLVVIFPTNVWKYDVVDYFPFDKNKQAKKQDNTQSAPSTKVAVSDKKLSPKN